MTTVYESNPLQFQKIWGGGYLLILYTPVAPSFVFFMHLLQMYASTPGQTSMIVFSLRYGFNE